MRRLNFLEFSEAVAFANRNFFAQGENDFLLLQPKVYRYPKKCCQHHYCYELDQKMVGLIGTYPIAWDDLKMLGIGTVCVEENYRKQGIMQKMFAYLDQNVFPDYDLLYLSGGKTRYEHFGFYKTGQKVSFRIKAKALAQENIKALRVEPYLTADESVNRALYRLYQSGEKVRRNQDNFRDVLQTKGYLIYLIYDGPSLNGYLVYDNVTDSVKEISKTNLGLNDVLRNFWKVIEKPELCYEVSTDNSDLPWLYAISDSYRISHLVNVRIINYAKVIRSLLKQKNNLPKGTITIRIQEAVNLKVTVGLDISVEEIPDQPNFDLVLTEREVHQILFDNPLFWGDKYPLLKAYCPFSLPVTLSSLDSF